MPPGEREELLRDVEANERDADAARQSGDQQQLLAHLERGLYLRRRLYPEASPEVIEGCRRLCEVCNCAATALLSQGHLKGAHDLLKRAEELANKNQMNKAITWNNMACYYRHTGKLRSAATLLERALEIEEHASPSAAAQTHLNLCATLSQLNRHADALYHAQSAMIRMYEILSPLMVGGKLSSLPLGEEQSEQVTVLCISYHNTAVEHEYLKNHDGAICAYSEGARWAVQFLGESHELVGILKGSVDAVKGKLKPGSGALKRAEQILSGKVQPSNNVQQQSQETSLKGGQSMGHLMTPRSADVVEDDEELCTDD